MSILFTAVRRHVLALMLLPTSLMVVNRAMALKNAENQDVRDLLSLAAQQSAAPGLRRRPDAKLAAQRCCLADPRAHCLKLVKGM